VKLMLIVIDTLRADHLGCYGYFRNTSPNIDKLAKEGVFFKDAHATAIPTGPGFTSIFTGLSPIHHGFYLTPWNLPNLIDFDDSIPTLPEIIQRELPDFATAAFDNLINFSSHMDQFVRGFEYYVNPTGTPEPLHHHIKGEKINQRLIPWLKEHKEENFFCFVHYWEPHTPYNQPPEFKNIFHHEPGTGDLRISEAPSGYSYVPGWGKIDELWEPPPKGKVSIDLYDGEIKYVDYLVGEIVKTLKSMDILSEMVIIITSDHGEQLGQHGEYGHSKVIEACAFIPLIIWEPHKIPRGKVVEGYAQQGDILPTILDLLGVKKLPSVDGKSLLPFIKKEKLEREEIFIEDHEYRALIQGKWKYIRNYFTREEELYNLTDDPMEVLNLSGKESEYLKKMRKRLNDWVKDNLKGKPDPMWEEMARWSARWNAAFEHEFHYLRPKPTLIKGIDD